MSSPSFRESQHPRNATGIFADKIQTPPDIRIRGGLSAEDRITAKVREGCPDALSWSTSATACHNGHLFLGPIYVQFEGGTIAITPHPLDDHLYADALAELTREWAPEHVHVDLTPAMPADPITLFPGVSRTRRAA